MCKKISIFILVFGVLGLTTQVSAAGNLILIRHGQSFHNIEGTYNSNPYHPNYKPSNLTDTGSQEAVYSATKLKIEGYNNSNILKVYVSPLPRTQQTAEILASRGLFDASKIVIEPRVIEIQAGDLEGQPHPARISYDWDDPFGKKNNGESRHEIRCRIQAFLNEVVPKDTDKNIVVITHGSPALQIIEMLTHEKIKLRTADSLVIPLSLTEFKSESCTRG